MLRPSLFPQEICRVSGAALAREQAFFCAVEAFHSRGRRGLLIEGVGTPPGVLERQVESSLAGMGLSLPPRRIMVRIRLPTSAVVRGPALPVALAVLGLLQVLPPGEIEEYVALGDLSADGMIEPVPGALAAALAARAGDLGLICHQVQGSEAAWAGCEVLPARDLLSIVNHFRGSHVLRVPAPGGLADDPGPADWAATAGMGALRRGLEVAAAGRHPVLFVSGTPALSEIAARALAALLPDLDAPATLALGIARSATDLLSNGMLSRRPPMAALSQANFAGRTGGL